MHVLASANGGVAWAAMTASACRRKTESDTSDGGRVPERAERLRPQSPRAFTGQRVRTRRAARVRAVG